MQKTQLTTTQLGHTGLEISRVGFGAWALGGAGYDRGWGAQDDDASIAAIHHARERIATLPKDDWRRRSERFQEPQLSRHLALVERLKAVAERLETTPGAVAVAWTLRNPAVDGAIVGFRRPDQVDPILGAANLELGEEDAASIEGRV